jgi:hypothetical protein
LLRSAGRSAEAGKVLARDDELAGKAIEHLGSPAKEA